MHILYTLTMQNRKCGGKISVILLVVGTLFVAGLFPVRVGAEAPAAGQAPAPREVGIDEKLGGTVALDIPLVGEDGEPLTLRQLIHSPTILALVYYRCPNVCDLLLTGIAGVLKGLPAEPGKDFNVVTVSIDDRETPADARHARRIGLESIERPFPPGAWRFLTGTGAAVAAVADSVGFRFARTGDYYDHPVGIIILSPMGKIVRYMNGADFLPADLKLSLLEASKGKVGPTIARFLRICFSYDPGSRKLVFNTLKVVASITLIVAGAFVVYLVLAGRRKRRKQEPSRRTRAHGG
jgi:protein SCO1